MGVGVALVLHWQLGWNRGAAVALMTAVTLGIAAMLISADRKREAALAAGENRN